MNDLRLSERARATRAARGVYERSPTLSCARERQKRVSRGPNYPFYPSKRLVLSSTQSVSRRVSSDGQTSFVPPRVALGAMHARVVVRRYGAASGDFTPIAAHETPTALSSVATKSGVTLVY